jgi:hypothetical protein
MLPRRQGRLLTHLPRDPVHIESLFPPPEPIVHRGSEKKTRAAQLVGRRDDLDRVADEAGPYFGAP